MRSTWVLMPLALAFASTAAAQERPTDDPPVPVEIRTSVSRTAVWLGDRVQFLVELQCAPQVDILTDDLVADRVTVRGLEIVDVVIDRDASVADRIRYSVRYTVVSYEIDAPTLSIAAIPVRYYTRNPGQRAEDTVPEGEVRVPALTLALRSTIPEGVAADGIRDQRGVRPLPRRMALAQPVGFGLLMVAVAPVAVFGADLVRRIRRTRSRARPRMTRKQRRAALEEIRALDLTSVEARREAHAKLEAWIRAEVELATGVTAGALTPAELSAAVPRPPRGLRLEQIQDVLVACERAKYAPEPPGADRWPALLEEADQILGTSHAR